MVNKGALCKDHLTAYRTVEMVAHFTETTIQTFTHMETLQQIVACKRIKKIKFNILNYLKIKIV